MKDRKRRLANITHLQPREDGCFPGLGVFTRVEIHSCDGMLKHSADLLYTICPSHVPDGIMHVFQPYPHSYKHQHMLTRVSMPITVCFTGEIVYTFSKLQVCSLQTSQVRYTHKKQIKLSSAISVLTLVQHYRYTLHLNT